MLPAMAGNAVETIVWSIAARNIGSIIDGKTAKNSVLGGTEACSASSAAWLTDDMRCLPPVAFL